MCGLGRGRGEQAAVIAGVECLQRLLGAPADQRPPVREGPTALLERERHVSQREFGVRTEVVVQLVRGRLQCLRALGGEHQQLLGAVGRLGSAGQFRGLLEDDVGVGAAESEGADSGAARTVALGPRQQLGVDVERAAVQADPRVGPLEVQGGRQLTVLHGQHTLDQSGDSGGGVEVSDVGLGRPDSAASLAHAGVGRGERGELDRVAEDGGRAVQLDVADALRRNVRVRQRGGDGAGLGGGAGSAESGPAGAVVVQCGALDDRVDVVVVGDRVLEAFQYDHPDAVAAHRPLGTGVEGAAVAVRREDPVRAVDVTLAPCPVDGDTTGQRGVALVGQQRLARFDHRDQRSGAGGLDVEGGALQTELVGDPAGEEVGPVADHRLLVAEDLRGAGLGGDVEDQIGVVARARVDADEAVVAFGVVPGALQGGPGAFEQHPVLRVHEFGLARGVAEEGRVELLAVLQHVAGTDEVRVGESGGVHAPRGELLVLETGDGADAGLEVAPVLLDRAGAWEAAGHADDGDVEAVLELGEVIARSGDRPGIQGGVELGGVLTHGDLASLAAAVGGASAGRSVAPPCCGWWRVPPPASAGRAARPGPGRWCAGTGRAVRSPGRSPP